MVVVNGDIFADIVPNKQKTSDGPPAVTQSTCSIDQQLSSTAATQAAAE